MSFCFLQIPERMTRLSFRRFVSSIKKFYIQLKNSATRNAIEKDEIISTCYSLGYKFLGSGCQLQKTS